MIVILLLRLLVFRGLLVDDGADVRGVGVVVVHIETGQDWMAVVEAQRLVAGGGFALGNGAGSDGSRRKRGTSGSRTLHGRGRDNRRKRTRTRTRRGSHHSRE